MVKPRPNRLGMYSDIRDVLDQALLSNGGDIEFDTHGAAVHWRQRAYKFRKLYAEITAPKPSQYDRLTFKRVGPDESTVKIRFIGETTRGRFIPREEATLDVAQDDILEFAESLAKRLDGDEDA